MSESESVSLTGNESLKNSDSLREVIAAHRLVVGEFIALVRRVPSEVWHTSIDGRWSPGQEAAHVALTWHAYTAEVRQGPAVTPDNFPPRHPDFREKVVPRILAGDWFPTGGVAPALVRPEEAPEREQVVRALEGFSESFESAFLDAACQNPDRFVRHPYFGALTLMEAVIVDMEHTKHHGRKLRVGLSGELDAH